MFYPLVGGQSAFETNVSPAAVETDDVTVMAARIKRELESKARDAEGKSEHAERHALAAREAAGEVDPKLETDARKLQAELEAAIKAESGLKATAMAARETAQRAKLAADALEDAKFAHAGPELSATEDALAVASEEEQAARNKLQSLFEQWTEQKAIVTAKVSARQSAEAAVKAAKDHEATLEGWRKSLSEAADVRQVPAEQLTWAAQRVDAARQAVERGAVAREALKQRAKAQEYLDAASSHRQSAEKLREAAKGTDEILSGLVSKAGSQLSVSAGRLVLPTLRGETYFGDLSDGERWRLALDIAIEAVGPKGALVIPQTAWEGLDPLNRRAIAEHVQGKGVIVFTAESSDAAEVTAEVFTGDE